MHDGLYNSINWNCLIIKPSSFKVPLILFLFFSTTCPIFFASLLIHFPTLNRSCRIDLLRHGDGNDATLCRWRFCWKYLLDLCSYLKPSKPSFIFSLLSYCLPSFFIHFFYYNLVYSLLKKFVDVQVSILGFGLGFMTFHFFNQGSINLI